MKYFKPLFGAITCLICVWSLSAQSATFNVVLVEVHYVDDAGALLFDPGGDVTWQYDDVSGVLTGTGTYMGQLYVNDQLYVTHTITDLSITSGGAASATSYSCTDGDADIMQYLSVCGQYNYGLNGIDESGFGDDMSLGPAQSIAEYDDNFGGSWDGSTLTMINLADCCANGIKTMTFEAVPIPATAWLLASALSLLGWSRRRAA